MTTVNESLAADLAREARAAGARPRRFGSWYVAEHRLRVARTYGGTMIATAIGTPFLYLFAFGIGLATLVSANLGPNAVDGVSYLVFVAPALVCSAALTIATEEFTYPVMLGFKWNPTFIAMNAAPLSGRQVMNGVVLFVILRMTAASTVYYLVMLLFGAIPDPGALLIVPIAVMTGLAFGLPLLAYSSSVKEDRGQFAVVMRVILLPVTLFSGTVFPISALPIYLQWIGWISPLWHGTQLARDVSYGAVEPAWLVAVHLLVLIGLSLGGWLLAIRIATRRLDK
jgi:lipooligosaccharide transport system permease protein